jgi:hypothetical protein
VDYWRKYFNPNLRLGNSSDLKPGNSNASISPSTIGKVNVAPKN